MFAYCHNNPILFVDASGYLITLATDATDEQKKEYERAIAYLKTSETGKKLIELLEESMVAFTVVFSDDDMMYYDPNSKTICFDTNSGLIIKNTSSVQSAALGLAHEMGHAAQELTGSLTGNRYQIETHNLLTYEIPIAQELGEPVRYNYSQGTSTLDMANSTHFITPSTELRPLWEYLLPWNWFKPRELPIHHNLDT